MARRPEVQDHLRSSRLAEEDSATMARGDGNPQNLGMEGWIVNATARARSRARAGVSRAARTSGAGPSREGNVSLAAAVAHSGRGVRPAGSVATAGGREPFGPRSAKGTGV